MAGGRTYPRGVQHHTAARGSNASGDNIAEQNSECSCGPKLSLWTDRSGGARDQANDEQSSFHGLFGLVRNITSLNHAYTKYLAMNTRRTRYDHTNIRLCLRAVRVERLSCPCRFATPAFRGGDFARRTLGPGGFRGRVTAPLPGSRRAWTQTGQAFAASGIILSLCAHEPFCFLLSHVSLVSCMRAQAPFLNCICTNMHRCENVAEIKEERVQQAQEAVEAAKRALEAELDSTKKQVIPKFGLTSIQSADY